MNSKTKKKLIQLLKGLFAWFFSLIIIVPFLIVVFNALKTSNEALTMSLSFPKTIHLENFIKVWNVGDIPTSFKNSMILSCSSVFISVLFSSLCAFVLSRNKTRINKSIYVYFSLGLMFPVNMVTVVKVMRWFDLYNSHLGVIFLFTALIMPLSVFLYYGFISSIPTEMDEAAIVDGAGAYTIFFQVIFPMLKPVTVTVVMINFLSTWNDFTIPLYLLPDPEKAVIVQQVYKFYGTFTASWNLVSVTILYAIMPIVIVYLLGQKYIISGMVTGAVKG